MDYAESRLYAQGDDARHIDWRVTARTGRAHTKVFHAERDRVTLLVADTAPALYFGTRVCFKSVQAARVGALAAWAAQRSGDRIAAVRGTRAEAPCAPAGGSRGALRTLDALARWYAAPPSEDLGLDAALQAAGRLVKPGARVLALVDPRSVDAVTDARWTAMSAHHEAIAVLLVDPLELEPPNARVAFVDDRSGFSRDVFALAPKASRPKPLPPSALAPRLELDLADSGQRHAWTQAFAARFELARQRLQRLGWRALILRTDESPEKILAALLPRRREAA
jgi:uncharacterized protein (DUF58 family)